MTKIISAFPGTGKSHLTAHHEFEGQVLDSDSSDYSWVHTDEGKVRNPDFPANYLRHINGHIGSAALILVSSHEEVRTALVDEGLDFTLVFPAQDLREEYLERFRQRGSPQGFINLIDAKWDEFLGQLHEQTGCDKIVLEAGQYLSDVL